MEYRSVIVGKLKKVFWFGELQSKQPRLKSNSKPSYFNISEFNLIRMILKPNMTLRDCPK